MAAGSEDVVADVSYLCEVSNEDSEKNRNAFSHRKTCCVSPFGESRQKYNHLELERLDWHFGSRCAIATSPHHALSEVQPEYRVNYCRLTSNPRVGYIDPSFIQIKIIDLLIPCRSANVYAIVVNLDIWRANSSRSYVLPRTHEITLWFLQYLGSNLRAWDNSCIQKRTVQMGQNL